MVRFDDKLLGRTFVSQKSGLVIRVNGWDHRDVFLHISVVPTQVGYMLVKVAPHELDRLMADWQEIDIA